ncbi:MAG: hypothetical protein ACYCYK_05305 [Candidatus Dormibacteria bacterium]
MTRVSKLIGVAWVMEFIWFVAFAAGGLLLVLSAAQTAPLSLACGPASPGVPAACAAQPNMALPVVLLAVGFVGFAVTGVVASLLAFRYLGVGILTYLGQRRTPANPPPDFGGPPSGPPFDSGLPPGVLGSPTGPPPEG